VVRPHVRLYRDPKTGIAWVEDGTSGLGHTSHANISSTGSVRGMKQLGHWAKSDRMVRSHGWIYNIDTCVVTNDLDRIARDACRCGGRHDCGPATHGALRRPGARRGARRHGDAGARVAPLRVYDMFRVFRAKYKSDGVPPSVVDDLISTYYDALQAINHHASQARGRPADVAELRGHFRRIMEKLEHHPILAYAPHIQDVIGEGKMQGQKWVSKPASPGFSLRNLYARALRTMEGDFDEAVGAGG